MATGDRPIEPSSQAVNVCTEGGVALSGHVHPANPAGEVVTVYEARLVERLRQP